MKDHVIVVGNPFDGMTIYGPYELTDELFSNTVDARADGVDWWIVKLEEGHV